MPYGLYAAITLLSKVYNYRVFQQDATGNRITWTYGTKNELLSETRYLVPDPDEWDVTTGNASGALTTRYVYDPKNHLRFVVTADGFVTEYRYNSFGQRIADITYKSFGGSDEARYYATGSTESDLLAWSGNLSIKAKLLVEYTETKYDFRGNVTGVTTYSDLTMNRIGFSQFDQGVKGWVGWESNPNLIQGSFVTGTDTNSQKKYLQATFKASSTSQVIAINADQNNWVGVTPGERLAVKAGVGGSAGLGNLFLRIQFIDAAGNWLQPSEIEVDSKTGAQAFNTQFAGFAVVPANAARARMVLYATASTLNTNISITLTEPIISQVMTDQVSQPVYSPGPTSDVWTAPNFAASSASYSRTTYVYDQFGNILSRQTADQTNALFVYDGLGRVISSTDVNAGSTSFVFNDSANTSTVTLASGLVKTSTYNLAGELIAYTEAGVNMNTANSSYRYDSLGRLRYVTNALGNKAHSLYDAVGRKVASISADGAITEYRYNSIG